MKRFYFLLVAVVLFFANCSTDVVQTDKKEDSENTDILGVNTMDENVIMTTKEIEILSAIYADKERIQEGKLFSHQEEALRELRAGMQYLAEKYPEKNLEILSFEPATKFNQWGSALFQDETSATYTLAVVPENGSYTCSDDYYGAILHEKYDKRVCEILTDAGYPVLSYTEFPIPMGMKVGIGTTVEELIDMKSNLTRNTYLFMEMPVEREKVRDALQEKLIDENLYGAYTVYFVPSIQNVEISELLENKKTWEKELFNCFDVK